MSEWAPSPSEEEEEEEELESEDEDEGRPESLLRSILSAKLASSGLCSCGNRALEQGRVEEDKEGGRGE